MALKVAAIDADSFITSGSTSTGIQSTDITVIGVSTASLNRSYALESRAMYDVQSRSYRRKNTDNRYPGGRRCGDHRVKPGELEDEQHLLVGGQGPQVVSGEAFELVGRGPGGGHGREEVIEGVLGFLLRGAVVDTL
jgi:hypothetical protein